MLSLVLVFKWSGTQSWPLSWLWFTPIIDLGFCHGPGIGIGLDLVQVLVLIFFWPRSQIVCQIWVHLVGGFR